MSEAQEVQGREKDGKDGTEEGNKAIRRKWKGDGREEEEEEAEAEARDRNGERRTENGEEKTVRRKCRGFRVRISVNTHTHTRERTRVQYFSAIPRRNVSPGCIATPAASLLHVTLRR